MGVSDKLNVGVSDKLNAGVSDKLNVGVPDKLKSVDASDFCNCIILLWWGVRSVLRFAMGFCLLFCI